VSQLMVYEARYRLWANRALNSAGARVFDPTCERLGVKFPGPTRQTKRKFHSVSNQRAKRRARVGSAAQKLLIRFLRQLIFPQKLDKASKNQPASFVKSHYIT
jgi:hypothetical protein